jgi:2-phosphosulfolactate phosphatase
VRIVLVPAAQALSPRRPLPAGPAVVIDALRATTTVVAALAAGAEAVEPVASVAAARRRARALAGRALLAGERHGDPLPGFDLGNSPVEAAARAPGRVLVLTTTNGTLACERLLRQGAAVPRRPVYAAALPNAVVAAERLARDADEAGAQGVALVCAGQNGHPATEDLLVAGALAALLPAAWERDDLALTAEWAWQAQAARPADALAASPHGRTLLGQGYADDIAWAARFDTTSCLPRLQVSAGEPPRFVAPTA